MEKEKKVKLLDKTINGTLKAFSDSMRDGKDFSPVNSRVTEEFYRGTESFINKPSSKGKWSLGCASVDLTPVDYKKRAYYMGGYIAPENGFKNLIEDVVDGMCGRAIALDDGSGRGVSLFCTVDCIGITNGDVRVIRKKFREKAEKLFPEMKVASVNIFSTHSHSCVDTEGLWTEFPQKLFRNLKRNYTGKGIPERGADEQYMRFLYEAVSDVLTAAVKDMCTGKMTLAQKDITQSYFKNKNRPSAPSVVTDITRLTFTPDDKKKRPTVIVNLPAHPDVAGLPVKSEVGSGRRLCGEYVYYMGEVINEAGYNFMFFNGAICAIYMSCGVTNDGLNLKHRYEQSARFGREIGKITLALTKSFEEIKKDRLLYNNSEILRERAEAMQNGGEYTLWCENWSPVKEKKVSPVLNIRLKEVEVPVLNPIMAAAGKLKLANYKVYTREKGQYSVFTEIGYMELGKELKIAMVPGEFCCDLLTGGESLRARASVSHTDFGIPPLREIFGDDTAVFGLANDEIGYIVPDNDFTMGDPKNHYHEFVSLGCKTASSVMRGFTEMAEELNINRS